jgi:hypothetical protein
VWRAKRVAAAGATVWAPPQQKQQLRQGAVASTTMAERVEQSELEAAEGKEGSKLH